MFDHVFEKAKSIRECSLKFWLGCNRYTSFSELFPLLAAGNLPLVKVGEITQIIDAQALTIENCVSFEGPVTATSFSASASFEIRSPKRIQVTDQDICFKCLQNQKFVRAVFLEN